VTPGFATPFSNRGTTFCTALGVADPLAPTALLVTAAAPREALITSVCLAASVAALAKLS
jgi:hypothetical protein